MLQCKHGARSSLLIGENTWQKRRLGYTEKIPSFITPLFKQWTVCSNISQKWPCNIWVLSPHWMYEAHLHDWVSVPKKWCRERVEDEEFYLIALWGVDFMSVLQKGNICPQPQWWWGLPGGSDGKESACNAGDRVWSLEKGTGYPLQQSCLENSTDRGSWLATVHGVSKSRTWLND